MRLSAHHPRQYSSKSMSLHHEEKDMLFALGLQVLVYNHLRDSNKSLQGFLGQVGIFFPFQIPHSSPHRTPNAIRRPASSSSLPTAQPCLRASSRFLHRGDKRLVPHHRDSDAQSLGQAGSFSDGSSTAISAQRTPTYHRKLYAPRNKQRIASSPSSQAARFNLGSHSSQTYNPSNPQVDMSCSLELSPHMIVQMDAVDLDWGFWENLLYGRGQPFLENQENVFI
jgi:hypothetical protein